MALTPIFLEYPLLRSLYADKAVKHTEWLQELENDKLPEEVIIEIIYFFQFIIAFVVKSLSFLEIREDLLVIVDKIYNKRKKFIEKYFKKANEYEFLIKIFYFIDRPPDNFKYGLCDNVDDTKNLYKSINHCINICFTQDIKTIKLRNYIVSHFKRQKIIDLIKLKRIADNIELPKLNSNAIYNLFQFFNRTLLLKSNSHRTSNNELSETTMDDYTNFILPDKVKISDFVKSIITSIIKMTDNLNITTNEIKKIKSDLKMGFDINIEEHEKTRNLITVKAFEITNEIMTSYINLPEELRNKNPRKLWMLARHFEFYEPLKVLLKSGLVKEEYSKYIFDPEEKYKDDKSEGYNILAHLILKYANLKKWAEPSRSKHGNEKYNGYFTKRVFEPFSIAFDTENLEKNIRDDKPPKKYPEFEKEAGLSVISKIYLLP
jgi:hypothetical protein